jgi:hypothetical protein
MTSDGTPDDIRCGCGRLLARRLSGRIEIKCRRCERTITIDLDGLPADGRFVEQAKPT